MFNDNFVSQLNLWSQKTEVSSLKLNRGIEREMLRVSANGSISQKSHPSSLGSPLTNPYITTDFAEALIELVTPKFPSVDSLYQCLHELHVFTSKNIDQDELLWAYSMPCKINSEDEINIANYGQNDSGMLKHIYRKGLKVRYGSIMQCVSGIHYNFSINPESYGAILGENFCQDNVNELYLGLIRNFKRNFWFILSQFGASSVIDKSFVLNREHNLDQLNDDDLFLENATSLRMSNIGYQSPIQSSLDIRYNSLNDFIESVKIGIKNAHPDFSELGLFDSNNNRQQISDGIIQIENELYDTIRPKRSSTDGLRPAVALKENGIEYVEVRGVDINPNELCGISKDQMYLLDLFLLHCAINESPEISPEESIKLQKNHADMVANGQNHSTIISYKGKDITCDDALSNLVNELNILANELDKEGDNYSGALSRIIKGESQSAVILKSLGDSLSFSEMALTKSMQNTNDLRQNNTLDLGYLNSESIKSIKEFENIENNSTKDIEAYVKKYNAQI